MIAVNAKFNALYKCTYSSPQSVKYDKYSVLALPDLHAKSCFYTLTLEKLILPLY